ncbi:MAG: cysteine peptidase family C39 domain-containing protein, partial [Gemmatimonadota bacterium]
MDVPYLPQSELLCGGAAAAMVLRYWGMSGVRAEDFGDLVSRTRGGIRASELANRLRELGWDVFPFDGRYEEIRRHLRLGRPVISLLEVGDDRFHYVVLIGEADDRLVLHDPAAAPFRLVDRDELESAWEATGGLSLLAVPSGAGSETVGGRAEAATGDGSGESEPQGDAMPPTTACRARLDRALGAAAGGRLAEADRLLDGGACRSEPVFLRELAGVRLRLGRPAEAVELARRALRLDRNDRHAARTLATALYVNDAPEAALAAWNRIGRPTVDLVRIAGL